ncbi:hypothetical protein [Frankia sp. AgB32]|uniref:hypothetical protein n=1 Tax=Frankia sp. AgB32 TaxID=631119 RepID=UPI002010C3DD|nr:hypothetical protein [Frankia sp. AgB32]MCK9895465.1 hypothetical protein [Frankia sp. AgB32]
MSPAAAAVVRSPGGPHRVLIDPVRLRGLVGAVRAVAQALRAGARTLIEAISPAGGSTAPGEQLVRLGAAFDAEATHLARRLAAAERADVPLPPARGPAVVTAEVVGFRYVPLAAAAATVAGAPVVAERDGARPGAGWSAGRDAAVLLVGGAPVAARTSPAAPTAGRRLGAPGGTAGRAAPAPQEALRLLATHGEDPGFAAGFYDTLGPTGLARLIAGIAGQPVGHRPAPSLGVDRRAAEAVLGRSFAAYSRIRPLDEEWLGRLNTRGRRGTADTVLLTPLLAAGRVSVALLDRLARLAFGAATGAPAPGPADHSGAGAVGRRPTALATAPSGAAARTAYEVALLDAIRAEPTLVCAVAARHVREVLTVAEIGALGLPVAVRLADATQDAWCRLVAAAGEPAARAADPRGSADFAARLARAVDAAGGAGLPPQLRAAFVPVLHTYRDEIYDAATAIAPGRTDPADPADGLREVPVGAWRSLLRECLRGGALAGLLARDAAAYGVDLERQQADRTRGWNSAPGGYPASPRTLSYLRAARAQVFLAGALVDAADAVVREHAEQGAAFRRRQGLILDLLGTVATAIDLADPAGTFARLGVGVTVDGIDTLVRTRYRDVSATGAREVLTALREASRGLPQWAAGYETSARLLWARRGTDPLRPVAVIENDGRRRVYSGDPRADGFITGPATDFLDAAGSPRAASTLTPTQRGAYLAWLASPGLVANNDRLTILAALAVAGETRVPPDLALRPSG